MASRSRSVVPGGLGAPPQLGEHRPRALGVDVIGREGRDTAPVVQPRRDEVLVAVGGEVRRRLDVDVAAEEEAGHGHRANQVERARLGPSAHRDRRLRPEVLDDDLLDVPVPIVGVANGQERGDALGVGLADADQDARGERDAELAGQGDGLEPAGRHLVGRAVVGGAGGEEAHRGALEHDAHAHVHLAESGEVALGHQPRVGVGQEPALGEHERAHRPQVSERGPVSHPAEEVAVLGEERLGLVAEGEERLLRPEALAGLGEGQDLLGRHREGAGLARVLPERAVPAVIAAERGQRDEDLGREGDAPPAASVPERRRRGEQVGEPLGRRVEQRLGLARVGDASLADALERALGGRQLEYCH